MGKNTLVILLCAATVTGCASFRPRLSSQEGWSGVCALRLVVITKDGRTRWTDRAIKVRTRWLEPSFRKVNLRFIILPVERLEKPDWIEVGDSEFIRMAKASRIRSETRLELTIWLVDRLTKHGVGIGGVAFYPSNLFGDHQHGIVVSIRSYDMAFVHEIGHAFNLPHAWKDWFTDTPTKDRYDCESDPCNAMAYCGDRRRPVDGCLGRTFSNQQIAEIRKWAQWWPRNDVVTVANPLLSGGPTYTGNTKPVIE